jgi:transcriptional regulator with XRE-family HTH domain
MKAAELSKKTNVPEGAISYYLSGKSQPKGDRLYILCVALDVSEAWMLGYDTPMARTAEQKRNDEVVRIVSQLKKDPKFFEIVSKFAELPTEQYDSLITIISALDKK